MIGNETRTQPCRRAFRILRSHRIKEQIMKALFTAIVLPIALGASGLALAAQSESAMQDCFKKHAQLMDKPAVKNVRDCWRMHGHLMQKSQATTG